jgi:AP-3 complex subunit beta
LGTLSHFLNVKATGYQDLPGFPAEAPDPSVRYVEPPPSSTPYERSTEFELDLTNNKKGKKKQGKKRSFYSESEGSEKSEGTESGSGSSDESSSGTGSSSGSGTEESESESENSEVSGNSDKEKNGN